MCPDTQNAHYLSVSSFADVLLAEDTVKYYNELPECEREAFHFKYDMPTEILEAVRSITSSAMGVDLIPTQFMKVVLRDLLEVLVHIFNLSSQSGVFPSIWKSANILPIPKTKNPVECKDFRPVSILCLLSNALEMIVHKQMYDYMVSNNIINKFQSGFRKGHSTVTTLIKVADDIRKAMDNKCLTLLVLLDFS